jgi:hypothetical protein
MGAGAIQPGWLASPPTRGQAAVLCTGSAGPTGWLLDCSERICDWRFRSFWNEGANASLLFRYARR